MTMARASTNDLHENDFYGWTEQQSDSLRRAASERRNSPPDLDFEHLAQEIWELGLSLELELYHRYVILLLHLLKWRYQPGLRGPSWRGSINEQRRRIERLLRKNPSLKRKCSSEFGEAYGEAREKAAEETGLTIASFPSSSPFRLSEAEDRDYWPE
jgi:Domain of unknown function DUF29